MNQMSSYGVAFCDELNIALSELKNVLDNADATGLSSDAVVISGHAIYDDRSSFAVYIPVGDACHKNAVEVSAAAEKVRTLIQQRTGVYIAPLRPDYVPPEGIEAGLTSFPIWGYAIIGVVGVAALAYITGQTAGLVRLFKSKRHVSGYRRRGRK